MQDKDVVVYYAICMIRWRFVTYGVFLVIFSILEGSKRFFFFLACNNLWYICCPLGGRIHLAYISEDDGLLSIFKLSSCLFLVFTKGAKSTKMQTKAVLLISLSISV